MKPTMKNAVMLSALALTCGNAFAVKEPVEYVSPNIGGIGQMLTATIPYVQWPHGMARLASITTPGITDRYLADKIYGFPAGSGMLMASTGEASTEPAVYASEFDHDFETVTPYYYAANLENWGIRAEFTAAREAAYYRFTFPASQHAHLALSMDKQARLEVVDSKTVQGSERLDGPIGKLIHADGATTEYFYAQFSKPFASYQTWSGKELSHAAKQDGTRVGFVTDSETSQGEQIEVRVGISYISVEQARRNLERKSLAGNLKSSRQIYAALGTRRLKVSMRLAERSCRGRFSIRRCGDRWDG